LEKFLSLEDSVQAVRYLLFSLDVFLSYCLDLVLDLIEVCQHLFLLVLNVVFGDNKDEVLAWVKRGLFDGADQELVLNDEVDHVLVHHSVFVVQDSSEGGSDDGNQEIEHDDDDEESVQDEEYLHN
jgi:hypothetical protein